MPNTRIMDELLSFINQYKTILVISSLLLFFGYGYFITTWSISIDSEIETFSGYSGMLQGRVVPTILIFLSNYKIIPFFNNFVSILLLFASSVVWCLIIQKNIKITHKSIFIFLSVYSISPIYVFILQYTIINIIVFFGMFLASLSVYYSDLLFLKNQYKRTHFWLSVFLLFLAVSAYEMYAVYYITSVLFLLLLAKIKQLDGELPPRNIIVFLFGSIVTLIAALILFKLFSFSVVHILKQPLDSYFDKFIHWGKISNFDVINGISSYLIYVFKLRLNFYFTVTLVFILTLLIIFSFKYGKKSLTINLLTILFFISPFSLSFLLGGSMPFRTLNELPLMMAGTSFLLYSSLNNQIAKRTIFVIVMISLFFNAQYITRLFYGDHMRLQYDMDYANRIYSRIIDKVGNSIDYKPVAIIAHHLPQDKPFIISADGDTIGTSFFEGDRERIHKFMSWLGLNYILPSESEYKSAISLSSEMPNYPAKDSVLEINNLIILKLSSVPRQPDQKPVSINFNKYNKIDAQQVKYTFDNISMQNNQINLNGWSYIKELNASNTTFYIKFVGSNKAQYVFPMNNNIRPDVAKVMKDGIMLSESGFQFLLNSNNLKNGSYTLHLILVNGKNFAEIDSKKKIML